MLAADDDEGLDPAAAALSKSRPGVLSALGAGGELQPVKQLGDWLVQAGHPLKPRTIQTALGELEAAGLAAGSEEGNGRARYWVTDHPRTRRFLCDAARVVDMTDALLGAVAGVAVGSLWEHCVAS